MTEFVFKIASSIKYGHAKGWKHTANKFVDLIKSNLDIIVPMLDLPERITVQVRPLKGYTNGLWTNMTKTLSIDPRKTNMDDLVKTFFHELVHAEQHHKGKLQRKLDETARRYRDYWEGVPYSRPSNMRSKSRYQKYLNLPWEKEAFEREKTLTVQFIKEMIR